MRELLGDLEVLNGEVFVCAVGNLLNDASILIYFEHLNCLLPVVYATDSSLRKLLLKGGLLLTDVCVGQFDLAQIGTSRWIEQDLIPHEAKDIFRVTMNVFKNLVQGLLGLLTLLAALEHDVGKLEKLIL